jgi:hypothetical protein
MTDTKPVMRLYPWDEIIVTIRELIAEEINCFQQFNCEHCQAKQTMERPNVFYEHGICEECGKETNIKKNGMNYMVHASTPRAAEALTRRMRGK